MRARFFYPVLGQNDDSGCVADSGQAVCDNDSRTPFDKFVEGLLNNKFAFVIEITCRLVKNNERRIFEKYARNADALALPA